MVGFVVRESYLRLKKFGCVGRLPRDTNYISSGISCGSLYTKHETSESGGVNRDFIWTDYLRPYFPCTVRGELTPSVERLTSKGRSVRVETSHRRSPFSLGCPFFLFLTRLKGCVSVRDSWCLCPGRWVIVRDFHIGCRDIHYVPFGYR